MNRHKSRSGPTRNVRLADQIRKDLAGLLQREFEASRFGLITLTGVDLSADYAHAKVYFTVLGAEPDAVSAALNDKAGWLHAQLFKLLHIHTVPRLRFIHDLDTERGVELARLIDQANQPQAAPASVSGLEDPVDPS